MKIQLYQILLFFFICLGVLYFSYPNQAYEGIIYEGRGDIELARSKYEAYLVEKPHDRKTALRLAKLYTKLAEPELSVRLLRELCEYRHDDFDLHKTYLGYLEDLNQSKLLFAERIKIVEKFWENKKINPNEIKLILEPTLQQALWLQRNDIAQYLLARLIVLSQRMDKGNLDYYKYLSFYLNLSSKNIEKLKAILSQAIEVDPLELESRINLVAILIAVKDYDPALRLIDESLTIYPLELDLLELRLSVLELSKNYQVATRHINFMLRYHLIKNVELKKIKIRRAELLQLSGFSEEALLAYAVLSQEYPEDEMLFLQWIDSLVAQKQLEIASSKLEDFYTKNPSSLSVFKYLVELNLYELKSVESTHHYLKYFILNKNTSFALDVAYLFLEKKQKEKAIRWLLKAYEIVQDDKMSLLIAQSYVDQKQYAQAILWFNKIKNKSPLVFESLADSYELSKEYKMALKIVRDLYRSSSNFKYLKRIAYLAYLAKEKRIALEVYVKLYHHRMTKASKKLDYVKEIYFLNELDLAEKMFLDLIQANQNEAYFWYAELLANRGHLNLSKKNYQIFLNQGGSPSLKNKEAFRRYLKASSMIGFNSHLEKEYLKFIDRYPQSVNSYLDLVDAYLRNKHLKKAYAWLRKIENKFHGKVQALSFQWLSYYTLSNAWKKVIPLAQNILKKNPDLLWLRAQLAEAYLKRGQWKKAVAVYKDLLNKKTLESGAYQQRYFELKRKYAHQLKASFDYYNYGESTFYQPVLSGRYYPSEKLRLNFRYHPVVISDKSLLPTETIHQLTLDARYQFNSVNPNWSLNLGLQVSEGQHTDALSPRAQLSYKNQKNFEATVDVKLFKLRSDFITAVREAVKLHQLTATVNWKLSQRVSWRSQFAYEHNYIDSADKTKDKANVYKYMSQLSYRLYDKPYINLNYRFSWQNSQFQGDFLRRVPLIDETNAHYIEFYLSHSFSDRCLLELSMNAGHDFSRDLNIYEGDILGFSLRNRTKLTKSLDLDLAYDYTRESSTGVPSQGHHFGVSLNGRWW